MNKLQIETIAVDNNKTNHHNTLHLKQEHNQGNSQIHKNNSNNQHKHHQQQHNQNFNYNVNLKFEPQIPISGKTTTIAIHITEQKKGNIIRDFETIHDKLMHLIIVY